MTDWSIEQSKELYLIDHWGEEYFDINSQGHLCIDPLFGSAARVDFMKILSEIERRGISMPVVIRFPDVLHTQVKYLCQTFSEIIQTAGYRGHFRGVYPLKVNPLREVVEEIVDVGKPYRFGLEAGSKPELLAALVYNDNRDTLTILNGYKDRDYLRLALLGRKLGRHPLVVIEKLSELSELLDLAREMDVRPLIGIRARLASTGSGMWAESGGERAKFGLTASDIVEALDLLTRFGFEDCLQLFHFHVGSQISDIRSLKDSLTEGARFYAQLVKQGFPIRYFDVGGGLGVDYDGSRSTRASSVNYSVRDYVEDVVYILQQICDVEDVEHPDIVSESGRMITAHHSCVVTQVIDRNRPARPRPSAKPRKKEALLVKNMRKVLSEVGPDYVQEAYNDALQIKDQALNAFKLGILSLKERATVETLFWEICQQLRKRKEDLDFVPYTLAELDEKLAEQYICNLSIFQSVPDSWAVRQLFPIVPLHRLDEEPSIHCTLADITCDSDGRIDSFVDLHEPRKTLRLHDLRDGESYYIGLFLTGAYQDVLGSRHNLFGALNEVHVYYDDREEDSFYIEEFRPGNSPQEVLTQMQYNPEGLVTAVEKMVTRQVRQRNLAPREGVKLREIYENCLRKYTYLWVETRESKAEEVRNP